MAFEAEVARVVVALLKAMSAIIATRKATGRQTAEKIPFLKVAKFEKVSALTVANKATSAWIARTRSDHMVAGGDHAQEGARLHAADRDLSLNLAPHQDAANTIDAHRLQLSAVLTKVTKQVSLSISRVAKKLEAGHGSVETKDLYRPQMLKRQHGRSRVQTQRRRLSQSHHLLTRESGSEKIHAARISRHEKQKAQNRKHTRKGKYSSN